MEADRFAGAQQMSKKNSPKIYEIKGNIFTDLGLDGAEGLHAKSGLIFRIAKIIKKRELTQVKVGSILGIDQPKVSNLLRGLTEGFSTDRLFRFLNTLDSDIEIIVKPKARTAKYAKVRVLSAH